MSNDIFFDYNIPPHCFAERARALIERFDLGEAHCLFYAALELRMGIEARLYQIIEISLKQSGMSEEEIRKKITEYVATDLLKKLSNVNPDAKEPVTIGISPGNGQITDFLKYTPVSQELASDHGKLGEILHFKFFKNNPNWFYKERPSNPTNDSNLKTLFSYRDFIEKVLRQLEEATSGVLLSPPTGFFHKLIK